MSLVPEHYLAACAAAQLTEVAPALEGSYAGGTAGTIGALLMLAVQDMTARPAREAAEKARLSEIFKAARAGGLTDAPPRSLAAMRAALATLHKEAEQRQAGDLVRQILDHYVATADAACLNLPVIE